MLNTYQLKKLIVLSFFLSSFLTYAEICVPNGNELYRFTGDENRCEDDLKNNGFALLNTINQENQSNNIPSTTEKNLAIAMLNNLTKNLVEISQFDQITMSAGSPILPTGNVAQYCSLDQINTYLNCPDSFSRKRVEELFGMPITEVVTNHFAGELFKSRNTSDGENNRTSCLASQDKSQLKQHSNRMLGLETIMLTLDTLPWDPNKNELQNSAEKSLLEEDPAQFIDLYLSVQGSSNPFIKNMLKDKESINVFMRKYFEFKQNNQLANSSTEKDKRSHAWSFYQSLFSDMDLMANSRETLSTQCQTMFQQFGDFVCKPMTFHAVGNELYSQVNFRYIDDDRSKGLRFSSNPNDQNSTYYLDYLYHCQGEYCYNESNLNIDRKLCKNMDDENAFNGHDFIESLAANDTSAFTVLNNNAFRDEHIYESQQDQICSVICQGNSPSCDPKRSFQEVEQFLKCGTQNENPACNEPSVLSWLELQQMQNNYQTQIAQYNQRNNINTEQTEFSEYSPFMRHFLGTIGQDVAAGRTPVLTGIKTEDRTPVDRETLAEAAEGRSDFDAPNRDRNPRRKTLTETLADIQQRGSAGNGLSTTEKANLNRGVASVGDALSAARPFTPLQAGSLGSQLASAIPTNDRQAFIEENARLMRDILSGQNRDLRGRINSLDDVLANNERQFNTGVNVNNNFDFPTADDNAGDETNRVSDFGLGVTGAPVEAPNQEVDGEPAPAAGVRRGAASSNNSGAAAVAGSTGTAAATGPRQNNSGPSYAATIDNLETITLEELQNQNIPLDRPFILVINAGDRSVSVRVVPMQHRGETILAPDISGIGEDEYFVYPLLKRATVFKKFFAYREERLNSIRSI